MTLRTRLVAILAILISLGLLVSGVLTYGALRNFLYDRVDDQLRDSQMIAARGLADSIRPGADFEFGGPHSPGSGGAPHLPIAAYAEFRDSSGEILARETFGGSDEISQPAIPTLTASSREAPFTVGAEDDPSAKFRVLATPTAGGGTLIVAVPLTDAQDTLGRLLAIEVVVAIVLVAAIAIGAWALIRRELRPLDQMTQAATEIAGGDLARRVESGDARTEVGRLGRALNLMLHRIEEAFSARRASEERMRRFLADASHELRTPLTSIRGYAELFRRGAAERPEDLRVSMRRIEDEAGRMGVLVEELLQLAHLDETRTREFVPVDFSAIVVDAAADARVRDPERSIEVVAPEAASVVGDEDGLRQAVNNLVANALTHTPEGSPVELRLALEGDATVLTVTDSGGGLDAAALEHAFDRFWRRDASRSRRSGGAGLGLAIVAAIARAHGGSVEADNVSEGGARFTLRIPVRPPEM
jgi:two-component system, OmpR family, sensor kinase